MLEDKATSYGFTVDVWAVGVTLFEFLTGQAPFESRPQSPNNRTLYSNIKAGRYVVPPTVPAEAKRLVEQVRL